MKHLFIPYELALIAKEKGFDEECLAYFQRKINNAPIRYIWEEDLYPIDNNLNPTMIAAPLYQQIVDWFREKHKISVGVDTFGRPYILDLKPRKKSYIGKLLFEICIDGHYTFPDYYFALNKAIEEALKLIK